ncbi:MAG: potassium transporter Kup [Cystobacterineae bacterium]|nr:potassium transporter Kup [Cystobacterineae bacterium]
MTEKDKAPLAPPSSPTSLGQAFVSSLRQKKGNAWSLALGAMGIVFGDIGTSPLYALNECFAGAKAISTEAPVILGVLSLMFWSLLGVVSFKYMVFIMRAHNKGEGGIFSLLALVPKGLSGWIQGLVILGALFGAALLFGDGVITPAISVLSAMEGLKVLSPAAGPWVVPLTACVLLGLFLVQKRGTGGIGRIFGPIMLLWFGVMAVLGAIQLLETPGVLRAVNPEYAIFFFIEYKTRAFILLGAVVLCITGGEALYADMGHFGAKPIRRGWLWVVLPALLCNYFGQGAYLLREGIRPGVSPFYATVPPGILLPVVLLATLAAVIASQALISGAFSITRQAIQLGFCPRLQIVHTSAEHEGQIYVPFVNHALMVACLLLVFVFRESGRLATAYGVAVTGSMAITSMVYFFVIAFNWKWKLWKTLPLLAIFLFFDLSYFSANILKFREGGWVPLLIAAMVFTLMTTWKRGRTELMKLYGKLVFPLEQFLEDMEATAPLRVRGTAVFMSSNAEGTPPVLLHHLKHNQVLHRQVVLMSISVEDEPWVAIDEQVKVEEFGKGFFRVVASLGFMQTPNVPALLLQARKQGLVCEPSTTSYYLGRDTLLPNGASKLMRWRKILFAFVSKNAQTATAYFGIPPGRVVELGMQLNF